MSDTNGRYRVKLARNARTLYVYKVRIYRKISRLLCVFFSERDGLNFSVQPLVLRRCSVLKYHRAREGRKNSN